jgi:hypothetical protein
VVEGLSLASPHTGDILSEKWYDSEEYINVTTIFMFKESRKWE